MEVSEIAELAFTFGFVMATTQCATANDTLIPNAKITPSKNKFFFIVHVP